MQPVHFHEIGQWDVERRLIDQAVLVRVHSFDGNGAALPDAVFTFRPGDPQHDFWESELLKLERSTQLKAAG